MDALTGDRFQISQGFFGCVPAISLEGQFRHSQSGRHSQTGQDVTTKQTIQRGS
jgi:hypothetical protein